MTNNLINKSVDIIKKKGTLSFIGKLNRRIIRDIIGPIIVSIIGLFFVPSIIKKLKRATNKEDTLDDSVNIAFNFKVNRFNFAPSQIREEILELLKVLEKLNPKISLEIGTAGGGTLFLFTRITDKNGSIISIDVPMLFYGGYPIWKIPIYKSFGKGNQKIYLLRKDSHKKETLEDVKNILSGRQVDFLFIDGLHTYEGVKSDFEMYSNLVRNGGIIAFHDIVPYPEYGINKFWNEIKNNYKNFEIVKDRNQDLGFGIGIIYK